MCSVESCHTSLLPHTQSLPHPQALRIELHFSENTLLGGGCSTPALHWARPPGLFLTDSSGDPFPAAFREWGSVRLHFIFPGS